MKKRKEKEKKTIFFYLLAIFRSKVIRGGAASDISSSNDARSKNAFFLLRPFPPCVNTREKNSSTFFLFFSILLDNFLRTNPRRVLFVRSPGKKRIEGESGITEDSAKEWELNDSMLIVSGKMRVTRLSRILENCYLNSLSFLDS